MTAAREPLTMSLAVTLGKILDACQREQPVTWLVDDGEKLMSGTIRHLYLDQETKDVRDAKVRVSATFEHWFPMLDLVEMVDEGRMVLNYRP